MDKAEYKAKEIYREGSNRMMIVSVIEGHEDKRKFYTIEHKAADTFLAGEAAWFLDERLRDYVLSLIEEDMGLRESLHDAEPVDVCPHCGAMAANSVIKGHVKAGCPMERRDDADTD